MCGKQGNQGNFNNSEVLHNLLLTQAWCLCCAKFYGNHKSELEKLVLAKVHIKNMAQLPSMIDQQMSLTRFTNSLNDRVTKIELKF